VVTMTADVRMVIHDAVRKTGVNPQIVTDNGSWFTAKDFKMLVRELELDYIRIGRTTRSQTVGWNASALVTARNEADGQIGFDPIEGSEPDFVHACSAPHKPTHVQTLLMWSPGQLQPAASLLAFALHIARGVAALRATRGSSRRSLNPPYQARRPRRVRLWPE